MYVGARDPVCVTADVQAIVVTEGCRRSGGVEEVVSRAQRREPLGAAQGWVTVCQGEEEGVWVAYPRIATVSGGREAGGSEASKEPAATLAGPHKHEQAPPAVTPAVEAAAPKPWVVPLYTSSHAPGLGAPPGGSQACSCAA